MDLILKTPGLSDDERTAILGGTAANWRAHLIAFSVMSSVKW